jgi:hypothetical protein
VIPIDGTLLSERLPDFFQLDLRLDRAWRRSSIGVEYIP